MIIKMSEVTSAALAKLLDFTESEDNQLTDAYITKRVFSLKSVNPGSEKGLYAVDLEMLDAYADGEHDSLRRTDPKYLVHVYEILVGN